MWWEWYSINLIQDLFLFLNIFNSVFEPLCACVYCLFIGFRIVQRYRAPSENQTDYSRHNTKSCLLLIEIRGYLLYTAISLVWHKASSVRHPENIELSARSYWYKHAKHCSMVRSPRYCFFYDKDCRVVFTGVLMENLIANLCSSSAHQDLELNR